MSKKPNLLLMVAFAIFMVAVVFKIADADDHHKHHDDDGDVIGGDNTATNSISGGRSFGLGLGDVDINDCLYSWSFIIQGVGLNKWCASERMDAMGLHDSAAQMRCTIRSVKKLYENKEQCISSQTVVERFPVKHPEPTVDTDEDDDDRLDALYARISEMEAMRVRDKANTEKVAKMANASAQTARREKKREDEVLRQLLEDLKQ